MKILFISSFVSRLNGANALVRLVDGMKAQGHDCVVLSYAKCVDDDGYMVLQYDREDEEKDVVYVNANAVEFPFMHKPSGNLFVEKVREIKPDIINLHWTHGKNYIPLDCLPELSVIAPLIWTAHDMWALTGGCFFSYSCKGFLGNCNVCKGELHGVAIGPNNQSQRALRVEKLYKIKREIYAELKNVHFVAPSNWMKKQIESSVFFKDKKVDVIHYGVPTNIFSPQVNPNLRNSLNIPIDDFVILFSSVAMNDPRKGGSLFIEAAKIIRNKRITVIVLGLESAEFCSQMPLRSIAPGLVKTYEQMAEFYNTADINVLPTRADNLPSSVLESLSCCIPVVSFNVGGLPDVVGPNNGYLARPESAEDLAAGIMKFYEMSKDELNSISRPNRKLVEDRFSIEKQAYAYEKLFTDIMAGA